MASGVTGITETWWDSSCDRYAGTDRWAQALQERLAGMMRTGGPLREGAAGVCGATLWEG